MNSEQISFLHSRMHLRTSINANPPAGGGHPSRALPSTANGRVRSVRDRSSLPQIRPPPYTKS